MLSPYQYVLMDVLISAFTQQSFLSADQRRLTCWVECPVTVPSTLLVLSLECPPCTLLHDVSSWGTHYYPITPRFSKQAAISQMVITSSEDETSVKIFLSGEVLFRSYVYPEGSFVHLHMEAVQSICLQSDSGLSGSELNSQKGCWGCGWLYVSPNTHLGTVCTDFLN